MSLFRRLRDTFRPQGVDQRLDDEFQFHLEQRIDDLTAQGMSQQEARREAVRAFGNRTHLHESARDRDLLVWLQSILQDVRFGARNLRRSPTFTTVAILSLAFGIGVNATIFTMVHGILLEKLAVPDPQRIVQVHGHYQKFDNDSFNYPIFRELERQGSIFSDLIGFTSNTVLMDVEGNTQRATAEVVTGHYFSFFQARPALGRLLDDEDDRVEGAHPVCVLSYDLWRRLFGGDPGALGRSIRVRGIALQIVGVAPADFVGPELQSRKDLFVPTSESTELIGIPQQASNYIWLHILGRLRRGLTQAGASARLSAASRAIEDALPRGRANSDAVYQLLDASEGYDSWRSALHDPLLVLMSAVGLVLLVACANLANLLLARAAERRQEFAIKMAIGSGSWRLMRQLLIEAGLLTAGGGALALLLSMVLIRLLLDVFNGGASNLLQVSPDWTVLWFTFGVCLLTVLLAGVYPAWHASRCDASPGLKESSLSGRRGFMRRSLILVQVMLAVVLLFGASLFAHSLRNLQTIDLGYRIDRVLDVDIGLKGTLKGQRGAISPPEMREILERGRHLPGVESAALVSPGVLSGGMMAGDITLTDPGMDRREMSAHFVQASPGLFATLGVRLLRGRDFSAADGPGAPWVAIVNQQFASSAWPGQDPLGKHLNGWNDKDYEVIGLTANSRDHFIREAAAPTVYLAFNQQRTTGGALMLRSNGGKLESAVKQIVSSVTPLYQVSKTSSMEVLRDNQIHQERLLAFLSSLFGALGTVLALVGIYGLIAYSVKRRTREIGIRVSVGAQRRDVLWLFLREASILLAAGTAAGLPLALLLARFVGKLLYQVPISDSVGIAVSVGLLMLGGLAASIIPARGALRVSPVEALRCD